MDASSEETFAQAVAPPAATVEDSARQVEDEPNADRIEQHTRDFIVKVLRELSNEEFEYFTVDLLRGLPGEGHALQR